jgi:hypothetical protein
MAWVAVKGRAGSSLLPFHPQTSFLLEPANGLQAENKTPA